MKKHQKQACCKEKTNELRSIDSEFFPYNMPVCFGTGYANIVKEAGLMSQPRFLNYFSFSSLKSISSAVTC